MTMFARRPIPPKTRTVTSRKYRRCYDCTESIEIGDQCESEPVRMLGRRFRNIYRCLKCAGEDRR